ncbi:hypothetical protein G7046_g429 [Stylonectria norvegica]|nr:hypothetical protein G7046_g429 [Stylonectria norvegica]
MALSSLTSKILATSVLATATAAGAYGFAVYRQVSSVQRRHITSFDAMPDSLRQSISVKDYVNPRNHPPMADMRFTTVDIPLQHRNVTDEALLATFVKGFFGGVVIAPERTVLQALGITMLNYSKLSNAATAPHIWAKSELSKKTLPSLRSILFGVFQVSEIKLDPQDEAQHQLNHSESHIDFIFGSDKGQFDNGLEPISLSFKRLGFGVLLQHFHAHPSSSSLRSRLHHEQTVTFTMAPDLPKEWTRLSFQEAMELVRLSDETSASKPPVQKFMSRQPAWVPGKELPWTSEHANQVRKLTRGVYGGVVYTQAPLAAARIVEQEDRMNGNVDTNAGFSIHSIHAVFTNPGVADRPFIFEVSNINSSRSFTTRLINVRQSTEPSSVPSGPFPVSDAQGPLGIICLTCLTTFKRPVAGPADVQDSVSPQKRYHDILGSRAPTEWDTCPQADIDAVTAAFPNAGHGAFPVLDMYKVDMTAFNKDKHVPERRELILYRLLKPLPKEDTNAHILCHAFEADRNGLIMLGNHLGYGYRMGAVASLSYSFYVHVNGEEAVMEGDEWWIQEVSWPRVSAGRGTMESRIWSPEGKHVASGYQDGMILPAFTKKAGGKL